MSVKCTKDHSKSSLKMSEGEHTIKVFRFSKGKDWSIWKELFLAQINRKDLEVGKCFDLKTKFSLTKKDGEKEIEDEAKLKTMRKAYDELLMSINPETTEGLAAFNMVKWSKNEDGTGDARKAFERLIKRYEPKTSLEKGKLLKQFYSIKCGVSEDPEQYVYTLENICAKIHNIAGGEVIADNDFMHQVLYGLPTKFESLSKKLQQDINKKEEKKLSILDMIEQLSLKNAKLKSGKMASYSGPEELAFVGFNQFKGKCNHCGKIGHKAANCWEKKKPGMERKQMPKNNPVNKGGFIPKCYKCGKMGHKKPDCPELRKPNHQEARAYAAMDEDVAFTAFEADGWVPVLSKKTRRKLKRLKVEGEEIDAYFANHPAYGNMPIEVALELFNDLEDSSDEYLETKDLKQEKEIARKRATEDLRELLGLNNDLSDSTNTDVCMYAKGTTKKAQEVEGSKLISTMTYEDKGVKKTIVPN